MFNSGRIGNAGNPLGHVALGSAWDGGGLGGNLLSLLMRGMMLMGCGS